MPPMLEGAGPIALEVIRVAIVLGAGLLVPAGIAKLRDPAAAVEALRWRGGRAHGLVRGIGVGELVLAAAVLVLGTRPLLAALAAVYAAFAVVALRQRRRGASCGCFGASTAPTSAVHVAFNAVLAAAAGLAASAAGPFARLGAPAHLDLPAGQLVLAGGLAVVGVVSVQQLLTGLPELQSATRRVTLPAPRTVRADAAVQGEAR